MNTLGYTDASGPSQAFKPDCDIHSVAEYVAVLDYNVAHVNAEAELDAPLLQDTDIA